MTHSPPDSWRGRWWDLPPLILHPFGRGVEAAATADSIRLALYVSGLGEADVDKEPLLRARYAEFRMLSLAGKDVMRWVQQSVDFARRDEVLAACGIQPQSFADFAVNHTPPGVAERFVSWGVIDYRRVLSRGIGVNAVFPKPPDFNVVSTGFLEDYYAYADSLFDCYQSLTQFTPLDPASFGFSLYTSDEYINTLGYAVDDEAAEP